MRRVVRGFAGVWQIGWNGAPVATYRRMGIGRLLGMLDDKHRPIAQWKLEGYTNAEIAERIGRSVPTVELRLRMIRAIWKKELPP